NEPAPHIDALTARTWPALEESLKAVGQTAPALAATVKEAVPALPSVPLASPSMPLDTGAAARLAPPALLFLAALRLGEVENWLGGKTLQTLRDMGRADLADRLAGDFGKISEQSQAQLPGGWKMISMPLMHDENMSQLQFFVRQQEEHEGKGQQGG